MVNLQGIESDGDSEVASRIIVADTEATVGEVTTAATADELVLAQEAENEYEVPCLPEHPPCAATHAVCMALVRAVH